MGLYKQLLDIITNEEYVFVNEKQSVKKSAIHTTILDDLKQVKPVLHLYKMHHSSMNLLFDSCYSYSDMFPVETYSEIIYKNEYNGIVQSDTNRSNRLKRLDAGFKLKYKYFPSKDIKFYSKQTIIDSKIRLGIPSLFRKIYDPTDVATVQAKYIYTYYIKIGEEEEEVSLENISKILCVINERFRLYKDVQYWVGQMKKDI